LYNMGIVSSYWGELPALDGLCHPRLQNNPTGR
jgi:hypothetical protein